MRFLNKSFECLLRIVSKKLFQRKTFDSILFPSSIVELQAETKMIKLQLLIFL